MSNMFQIERRNNLSINVFTWEVNEDSLIPCYHGSESGRNVDLLLFINGDERHYLLIKNFAAVMRYVIANYFAFTKRLAISLNFQKS